MMHPIIRGVVTEADLDIMDYLVDVDVEDFEDIKSGYRMKFTFAEGNPFFSNRSVEFGMFSTLPMACCMLCLQQQDSQGERERASDLCAPHVASIEVRRPESQCAIKTQSFAMCVTAAGS